MLQFKYSSDELKIDETNTILTNIRSSSFKNNTCFIGNWIESEEIENKILEIKINRLSSESCFFIGLAPSDDNIDNVSMEECCTNSYGYCGNGRIYFNNNELKTVDDCTTNDILKFIFNVQNWSLSLKINNNDEIILFTDIIPTKYKFAISLCYADDECTIIQQNIGDKEPTPEPTPPSVQKQEEEQKEEEEEQQDQQQNSNVSEQAPETEKEEEEKNNKEPQMEEQKPLVEPKTDDQSSSGCVFGVTAWFHDLTHKNFQKCFSLVIMSHLDNTGHLKHQNKNNENSKYLIAFDFDQTLPIYRVHGQQSPTIRYIQLFGGSNRIHFLSQFFKYLKQFDVRIIIISWNVKCVIKDALKAVDLYEYFDDIYDRSEMIKNGGYHSGKANIMYLLSQQLNINKQRCIMVDDCKEILECCSNSCQIIHVQNERGITNKEITQIIKTLKLKHSTLV